MPDDDEEKPRKNEAIYGIGAIDCRAEDGQVRLQVTIGGDSPLAGRYYFFKFPPREAHYVIERIRACLYEIAAMEDEGK